VEAQWVARDRHLHLHLHLQRFVTEQPPYSLLVRGIEEDVLPTVRHHGMGHADLQSPRRRLALRALAQARRRRAARPARRGDGLSLIEMAVAFVIHHPGVTSALIGPRTMEHSRRSCPPPKSP
jgi:aryl-alcohol dehydrogenase-like predicted oxidoreductase